MRISDWSSDVCSSDLAEKCGLHDPERAVTLLGNDDLRLALVRRLFAIELRIVVDLVAVDHQHEIGVLFDTAGLTQIRHLGALVVTLLNATIELRSEEHTSELQSLMRISYAVFCLNKKKKHTQEMPSNL